MKLTSPTLGPIVGHTTSNEARIWFRGEFQDALIEGTYRRCFGVVRWREKGKDWNKHKVGKLSPNFDMTGVFSIQGLVPKTIYEYQCGWLFVESELDAISQSINFNWSDVDLFNFKSATDNYTSTNSFIVGSCRYLLKLFGGKFFDDRGDKTFRSILEQHENNPIDAVLMIGDQIYADDLNFIAPDKRIDQFFERYQTAFSQPHIRSLMSRIPTYMILDDHEIEDNWPNKARKKDMTTLYPTAIHAYQIYQCSHSPVFNLDNNGLMSGTPTRFWYSFTNGCTDWFIMDVRTERIWDEAVDQRQMIKKAQMEALINWLSDNSGRAKMIVSSVPFIPDLKSDVDDKWGGFLRERTSILNYIFQNNIKKVAFISGDVHCSFTIELTSPDYPSAKILGIISSSLFWPYPHMESSDFTTNGTLAVSGKENFILTNPSKIYSIDNFARIDVDGSGVSVSYYERKGKLLDETIRMNF
ncbi:MAG: alkaline phosphatase D family protein [Sulfuricurvum sp.]|uniref:alkaline phosphatase D family protein n=1 Tax=Sulfuricurvum sp. TaxID=2025608 RepID=UPI0027346E5A|nr:alkaline phosphatase D family protein [Sulfuricurvum sp.]MDP3290754.1 alkaline phosphatase D family protein [Sulfuricurvum sp.]